MATRVPVGNGKFCYTENCRLHKDAWMTAKPIELTSQEEEDRNASARENWKLLFTMVSRAENNILETPSHTSGAGVFDSITHAIRNLAENEEKVQETLVASINDFCASIRIKKGWISGPQDRYIYQYSRGRAVREWLQRVQEALPKKEDKADFLRYEIGNLLSYYEQYDPGKPHLPASRIPTIAYQSYGANSKVLYKIKRFLLPNG